MEDQFKQVIFNLIKNSIDSISGEGTIILATEKQGSRAIIKITDTGQGISEDNKKNIFDVCTL